MTDATAALYDVSFFDGRIFSLGDFRRIAQSIRRMTGSVVFSLAAVAALGLLVASITFAAAWIVSSALSANSQLRASASMGPRALALALDAPTLADAPAVTFADKWARATSSMQVSAVPLATPHTQVAKLEPVPVPAPVSITPLPPRRPLAMANIVPLPRAFPGQRAIAQIAAKEVPAKLAPPAAPQVTSKVAAAPPPPAPVEKRVATREAPKKSSLPGPDSRTAVYDISAHTVYLPNGQKLEAHSGLGDKLDDPRYVKVRMRGPTPPNVYQLTLREEIFHGVRAIRLNPVDDDKMYGRAGMLAHTYMLGPNGQSNGCVSFKDYQKFLNAYLKGDVERLVVVAHLDAMPSRFARAERIQDERYAANN